MSGRTWAAAILVAALVAPLGATTAASAATPPGLRIADGRLVEADGSPFVMRGVNHAHTWYPTRTQSFADVSELGANAVRTVLSSGDRWTRNDVADVRQVVQLAKDAQLISILEVHDTTGYGEEGAAIPLSRAVDYWISIKDAVIGQEDYVLVNIGNEPYGNSGYSTYAADTIAAVERLRDAGIRNTIVVDAPNWGQDWSGTMRDSARAIFDADPDRNVLFSVHMYGVYDTAQEIRDYLSAFQTAGLPLIVGEFGHYHSDGDPDEDTILAETQSRGIGWLGWSWSGNGGGVEYLDLATNFDPDSLSSWGQRLFDGADGIAATAQRAGIFGDGPGPTAGGACTAVLSVPSSWAGGFQAGVQVAAGAAAISSWTVSFTLPSGSAISNLWSGVTTGTSGSVTVANAAWNGSLGAGQTTSFGFVGTGTAPAEGAIACTG